MDELSDPNLQELAYYVQNCARSAFAPRLQAALLRTLPRLKGTPEEEDEEFGGARSRGAGMRDLRRALKLYACTAPAFDPVEENAAFARDEFGLDPLESEIVLLAVRYCRNAAVECFYDEVSSLLRSRDRSLACFTGSDPKSVHERLSDDSLLVTSGVVTEPSKCMPEIVPPLYKAMKRQHRSRGEWAASIFGDPLSPVLSWEDFEHLGAQRDLAARLLDGAGRPGAQARSQGLNLLFHGPVGTGKTEFCKVLAAKTGRAIWSVGEKDEDGDEAGRGKRLASLRLAQRLLGNRLDALLLFDEAEDVLACPMALFGRSERNRSESKVFINRMMESNTVPVLWTCNDLDDIDPAVRRRMIHAVEIGTPDAKVRVRIMRRALAQSGLELADAAVERLARRYEMPPAVAVNAVRAAELAGGGEADIEQAMSGVLRILGIGPLPLDSSSSGFDCSLINCTGDLGQLTARLAHPNAPLNWSLCLHGAPGTGKSRFARHLAEQLGLEVMQKRASDLLSMWVGESEQNIARAFAAARARRAVLIVDEADSLLADRRDAVRSWEITQVNEMLTWMENHPLPFVCTTNLMDRLDRASLRRFTFKLRFDPLTPEQSARGFAHFFGMTAPESLPDGLTPGDFATVRRKRELIGAETAETLILWLAEEVEARDMHANAIGFLPRRSSNSSST